jgi:hypothetical protein
MADLGPSSDTLEGVNSTMIYCKKFCKYHNAPPVQQKYNKNEFRKIKKPT